MPAINPNTPGNSEHDARKANGGDAHRLDNALARSVVRIAQSWISRQTLKLAAAVTTFVSAFLLGRFAVSEDTAGAIAAGAAAVISGLAEIALSYLNMKLAPKAQPVTD